MFVKGDFGGLFFGLRFVEDLGYSFDFEFWILILRMVYLVTKERGGTPTGRGGRRSISLGDASRPPPLPLGFPPDTACSVTRSPFSLALSLLPATLYRNF